MPGPLQDEKVLVIGRGSGMAGAVAIAARDTGALVTAAGRDKNDLDAAYANEPGFTTAPSI